MAACTTLTSAVRRCRSRSLATAQGSGSKSSARQPRSMRDGTGSWQHGKRQSSLWSFAPANSLPEAPDPHRARQAT
eukprot:359627-Prymnesium_polylepis.2